MVVKDKVWLPWDCHAVLCEEAQTTMWSLYGSPHGGELGYGWHASWVPSCWPAPDVSHVTEAILCLLLTQYPIWHNMKQKSSGLTNWIVKSSKLCYFQPLYLECFLIKYYIMETASLLSFSLWTPVFPPRGGGVGLENVQTHQICVAFKPCSVWLQPIFLASSSLSDPRNDVQPLLATWDSLAFCRLQVCADLHCLQ